MNASPHFLAAQYQRAMRMKWFTYWHDECMDYMENKPTIPEDVDEFTLQMKIIYGLIVAGKSANVANAKIALLFRDLPAGKLPFVQVREWIEIGILRDRLEAARIGNYGKTERGLCALVTGKLDLRYCTPRELEAIPGIGPKTARFFILWTRPKEKYAILDVHILRWLREHGYTAPKSTPQNPKRYRLLEECFLREAKKAGLSARELDLRIWAERATALNRIPQQFAERI